MQINIRRLILILISLVSTFIILRLYLHNFPNSNFDVAGYNIHHLFTGIVLIVIAGLPLILFSGNNRLLDLASITFGAGLSMVLDEWIYLITTDGSDSSYLLPISFWGGAVVIGITACYLVLLSFIRDSK